MKEKFVRSDIHFDGILTEPIVPGTTQKGNRKVSFFIKDKAGLHACYAYSSEKTKAADTIMSLLPGDHINCLGFKSDDGRNVITSVGTEVAKQELGAKLRAEARRKTPTDDHAKLMRDRGYVRLYSRHIAGDFWAYSWMHKNEVAKYGKRFEGRWYLDEAYEKLVADREEAMKPTYILDRM